MKIFYAAQATGNGHISRAAELYPYLQKFGSVDFLLSGSNASLATSFPVKYRSKGMSLFYAPNGGINYLKTGLGFHPRRLFKEASKLPLGKYDIIINDFDFLTAYACKLQGVSSVQFGHQASFISPKTPRPIHKSWHGELILQNYAPASHYVGLHFQPYDDFIFSPIIKSEILNASPSNQGHITTYLPAHNKQVLLPLLKALAPLKVECFSPDCKYPEQHGNLTFLPVSGKGFNKSLIHSHGVLTAGGFETPAEALYLNKKVVCVPIKGQYEQDCNAAAYQQMGGMILSNLQKSDAPKIKEWFTNSSNHIAIKANNIPQTLEYVFNSITRV